MRHPLFIVLSLLIIAAPVRSADRIDGRLSALLERGGAGGGVHAGVFFTDKGTPERFSVPTGVVSERSLQRRARVRPADALVDVNDLPLDASYVRAVAERVERLRQRSRWLNAVSVEATPEQLRAVESLPFVHRISPLLHAARVGGDPEAAAPPPPSARPEGVSSFDYGASFTQLSQMNVPAVHDLGNYGQGVVVGVFDNGFRLLAHEAFDTLRPRILAQYDFVDGKESVVPVNPDPAFGSHGVNTLSTIGGFRSGQLIGPAFGATYILARTENDSSETPFEEDHWVAAIEWADSIGVDVTSTSLGYLDYDPPYASWTWEDMDGNTTAITRAADMAVARGIIVVNSAGNEGLSTVHNTLGAPADGDSVFTIGAVTAAGVRSSFSSVGPTTSTPPRIKPDVMAQGSTVRVARSTDPAGYTYSQGTSFSCPLAAGVVAMMLHARPTDTPVEIMNALRSTASRAATPDNLYGWGIINALAALRPAPVTLVSPADGAADQPASPAFRWTSSRWATAYRLQVASDTAFTALVFDDSTLTDTLVVVPPLTPGVVYFWRAAPRNLYGSPPFTSPRSFTVGGTVTRSYGMDAGWNVVALPLLPPDPRAAVAFPTAQSPAFVYDPSAGYLPEDSLAFGRGYWLKFPEADSVVLSGLFFARDTVVVSAGWNMIGGPSAAVDSAAVVSLPAGIRLSPFYGFHAGFSPATALLPGRGYWVKVSQEGILVLGGGAAE